MNKGPGSWVSYQIRKIAGCACAGNAGNVFPRHRFQRKPLVSDPGMHHGTCVTHVPWCMSGSLTCGDGENVPGIPGACAPAILRIWQEAHHLSAPPQIYQCFQPHIVASEHLCFISQQNIHTTLPPFLSIFLPCVYNSECVYTCDCARVCTRIGMHFSLGDNINDSFYIKNRILLLNYIWKTKQWLVAGLKWKII